MNLLDTLKNEICKLGITDKLEIAKYIYIRTGQLFNYDPFWYFSDNDNKKIIQNRNIDINNVNEFYIVCISWSKMYSELLNSFGIPSRVKYTKEQKYDENKKCYYEVIRHAYVEVFYNKKIYKADITGLLQDFISIKFGYKTNYNCQLSKDNLEDHYEYTVDVDGSLKIKDGKKLLNQLKETLSCISKEREITREEYVYQVYKLLENIDFSNNVGFVIGKIYIETLLRLFINYPYEFDIVNFFDNNKGVFITVHKVMVDGMIKYFSFENLDGIYKFLEIPSKKYYLYQKTYESRSVKLEKCAEGIVKRILKTKEY